MTKRPTIADLAKAAGVSVATVDRVLNNRHSVKEGTAFRVLEAAENIGFYAAPVIRQRLQRTSPQKTFCFLLQKSKDPFYQQFGELLQRATEQHPSIQGKAIIHYIDEVAPKTLVKYLFHAAEYADAIAMVAVDQPLVNDAVEKLAERNIPVFCLLSDISAPSRAGYLGVDGRKSGRTAAWLIDKTTKQAGEVGILVGTHRYLGQELCEMGFRSYFREHESRFSLLESTVGLDDDSLTYDAVVELLSQHPNLVGLYSAGGGRRGLIQALQEEKREQHIVVVCNELLSTTRAALLDGTLDMVLATPIERIATQVVALMANTNQTDSSSIRHINLPVELYIAENV